jgi:hypothetical protein
MAKKETTKKGKPGRKPKAKIEKPVIEETVLEEPAPIEEPEPEPIPVEEPIQPEPAVLDVVNGDPAVVAPAEENKEENPFEVSSLVAEEIVTEVQPEEYEAAEPVKKKVENKPKPNVIRKILGYFWNGQEMDY